MSQVALPPTPHHSFDAALKSSARKDGKLKPLSRIWAQVELALKRGRIIRL